MLIWRIKQVMSRQGEEREKSFDNIKDFWISEATEWGESPRVTIRDLYFRIHELNTLLSLIPRTSSLLDVGCGTGFGTLILAQRAEQTIGVDYSPPMIEWAERLRDDQDYRMRIRKDFSPLWDLGSYDSEKVKFAVGDILNLKLERNDFDVITGQRILINLPTHEEQMRALENLRECAGDNALLLLIEVTQQGHERTDVYREHFGLPKQEKYWHNKYLDESRYSEWKSHGWDVKKTLSFDTYMLLSRIVYPMSCGLPNCDFVSGANAAAMEIANTFRSKASSEEVGILSLLELYVDRVERYNKDEARLIRSWIEKHGDNFPDWSRLGHQNMIVAYAC
jgi:SAM-dependent methyltransferase